MERLRRRFERLYPQAADRCLDRFRMMVGRYGVGVTLPDIEPPWSERDAVLITYGDMIRADGEHPLAVLHGFLGKHLRDAFSSVHILPFFPYSSDDGFSVVDYRAVDEHMGTWDDVAAIARDFKLMVDLVLNHVSRKNRWFRDFVTGVAPARFYFIEVDPDADLSSVVRPRNTPLLRPVPTRDGLRHVWTTFSEDQIDLNFANPDVLFEFLDILFWYVANGARIIRLDAIAYLWKKVGTPCIHLPEAHEVVKLFRDVLELVAPNVLLITETNVPHAENLSYFGEGDEAHMVYQFTLPPLLLHALQSGDGQKLKEWARSLPDLPPGQTFLNFTASHDGIGVRPVEDILSQDEFQAFVHGARRRGGQVSTKTGPDGVETPYELNITYWDACADPDAREDTHHAARFLCSQTIPLALRGIPAVYFNSLFAAPNDHEQVKATGRARSINRRKWRIEELEAIIARTEETPGRVFQEYLRRLRVRRRHRAFHPDGAQRVLDLGEPVFAVERVAPDESDVVVALHNLTPRTVRVQAAEQSPALAGAPAVRNILTDRLVGRNRKPVTLAPYGCAWLTPAVRP